MLTQRIYPAFLPSPADVGIITKTEMEILKRAYLPDKHIADDMNISYHTVRSHKESLQRKLGHTGKELIVYAAKKGYIN